MEQQGREAAWVRGAYSSGSISLPGSVVSLPLTKLSWSLLVSDFVILEEMKLKRALSLIVGSVSASAFPPCPRAGFRVGSLTCLHFGLL